MKTIYIDVETTGLNKEKDFIIELAAIYEDKDTGKKSIFHEYCTPPVKVSEFIQELTGITIDVLRKKGITDKQLYTRFNSWLCHHINRYDKTDKALFIAYNARFDYGFCRQLFVRNANNYFGSFFLKNPLDILSTVMLAVKRYALPALPNFKNTTIAEYLQIPIENAHSAIDDIKASKQVQEKLEDLLCK